MHAKLKTEMRAPVDWADLQCCHRLPLASHELQCLAQSQLLQYSSLYTSKPMGPQNQPDYVNAVAKIHTHLSPLALLDAIQQLEQDHHRMRIQRWGPRTLDIDLLLYGNETINIERLTVPHVGIRQRNFVLYPLAEISPLLQLPDGTPLAQLLTACPLADLSRLKQ